MRRRRTTTRVVLPEEYREFRGDDWLDRGGRAAWHDAAVAWGEAHGMSGVEVVFVQWYCHLARTDPARADRWVAGNRLVDYRAIYGRDAHEH